MEEGDVDKRMEDEEDRGRRKGVVPGLEKREEDRRKCKLTETLKFCVLSWCDVFLVGKRY